MNPDLDTLILPFEIPPETHTALRERSTGESGKDILQ